MYPTRVGPYRIERKIGAGGMGTVYLGRHIDTDEEAAIKVLPASLAREDGFIARFAREIDALKKLQNANIVGLYESGVDDETYYYSMEYVEGETLTGYLRREKRIPWRKTIDMSLQICAALKAAHVAGIVHRDLKPSNLLISTTGTVKLTDFGVAQVFAGTKLTATGGIIGTAEYMSPEQAQGQRANKRSDLYSLGAVMYAMLTGRPPFSGKTTLEIIQKHRYGRFDRPYLIVPEIPHWLDDIVCQLLEKDPEKRFADAYVLSRRLQEVVKKVELSSAKETGAEGNYDGTAPTMAVDEGGDGPGVGTIMRDLVRVEIEESERESLFHAITNNTWVLVFLLLLTVSLGVYWMSRPASTGNDTDSGSTDEAANVDNADWLRHSQRIRKLTTPEDEAQMFLHQAMHYRDMGDTELAERKLAALSILLEQQPQHEQIAEWTEQLLEEVRSENASRSERHALLTDALQRADTLAEAGETDEARKIWQSVVELYDSDPSADEAVQQARSRLGDEVSSTRSGTEDE